MARSGSKFLRSLLNKHPDINDVGEIFHNRKEKYPDDSALLQTLGDVLLDPSRRVGFQFRFPRHFNEFPEIVELLEAHNEVTDVIFLMRRNKLKGAVSQQNAEIIKADTGRAHLFQDSTYEQERLALDVDRAIKETLDREAKDQSYLEWVRSRFSVLVVYYEDLCDHTDRELNRILEFLDLAPFKPDTLAPSNLVKITSDDLTQALSNFGELKDKLGAIERLDFLGTAAAVFRPRVAPLLEETIDLQGGGSLQLRIDKYSLRTNTRLLEDSYGRTAQGSLICSVADAILESRDHGQSWTEYKVGRAFSKCFTLSSGQHLLQADDNGRTCLYDEDWLLTNEVATGAYPWHGSWSVDENPATGTVIWAEYPFCASEIAVWRSVDGARSWTRCFSETGDETSPNAGRIRHFHLVQHCTTTPGRWYLSSGDSEEQCRLWVSEDDGQTWQEVTIADVTGAGEAIPPHLRRKLLRFTAMVQTQDALFWPTDDTFRGDGARVCVVDKADLSTVFVMDDVVGPNEMRNFVRIDDRWAMAVSEAKLDPSAVSVALVNLQERRVEGQLKIPNATGTKTNFAKTISALAARDGTFHTQGDNRVFRPAPMVLRWTVS